MNRLGLIAVLLALACSAAPGATPTAVTTPQAWPTLPPLVDAPLPAEVAAKLQAVLDDYVVQRQQTPSISAAVLVPGVGTWYGISGFADSAAQRAATPDTVYAIGSITKTFVAALILCLAEEDFLDLDDPAADHLGPVAASKTNSATMRQLLGHRSGIDDYVDHFDLLTDKSWSVAELLELVGEPDFAPGERFEYSNTNYLLLGLVAEEATGRPIGELLHEYLIDRFDLERTYYGTTETAAEPLARGYVTIDGELTDIYDGSGHLPFAASTSGAVGAGSMASTTADLGRWIYLLYGGHVLRVESQAQMLDFSDSTEYGLGTELLYVYGTGELIGHNGGIPGFMSDAYMARDSGTIVVILTNGETLDLSAALIRLFLSAAP